MTSFVNRVTIVSGASSGIGLATARHLAEQGASVIALARRADKLAKLQDPGTGEENFPRGSPIPGPDLVLRLE